MENNLEGISPNDISNEVLDEGEHGNSNDRESSIESFHTNKSHLSIPTENELIDIDDIELSDEESWLYQSPKKLSTDEKANSAYNWLHKDVEDMNNLELHIAKNALITKLNELKLQNTDLQCQETKEIDTKINDFAKEDEKKDNLASYNHLNDKYDKPVAFVKSQVQDKGSEKDKLNEKKPIKLNTEESTNKNQNKNSKKNNAFSDEITEIHKLARLQEESLRQSTSRFLSQAEKKFVHREKTASNEHVEGAKLSKPISAEALNICNGKLNASNVLISRSPYSIKQQSLFGSTVTLSQNHDMHRGSLPNINKGYYSLRPKKSKPISDKKLPCPLPIYPTHQKRIASGISEASIYESQSKLTSPPNEGRESRTLPSSYRVNSRSNSTPRREHSAHPPLRRESTPLPLCQRNSFVPDLNRRDSAPCNPRKLLSPVKSPAQFRRSSASSPMLRSPPKASTNVHANTKSPPPNESHQYSAHSLSRRQPLSIVHNQSPKCTNNQSPSPDDEIKSLKPPSKIPSPAPRSGIPVPSANYISRHNDKSWSQDCF